MTNRARFARGLALAGGLTLACTSGCVNDGPQPPPRPQPREITQPANVQPQRIVLSAEPFPVDTDENGFYDTFGATVFLFGDETRYPLPVHAQGRLELMLTDPDGRDIAVWALTHDQVNRARARSPTGLHGYALSLNINDVATDRLPATRANLTCRFIPEEGPSIVSRGSASVRVGPAGIGVPR